MLDIDVMDTTEFKTLDETIINNSLTPQLNKTVDKEYSDQMWYKEYKQKSTVFNCLEKHITDLNRFGFNVDDAIKCVCSILNFNRCNIRNTKTYFKIPDRVLCDRIQCSRERLHLLIKILQKIKVVDIQIDSCSVKIRIDRNVLLKDEYIKIKSNYFAQFDAKSIAKIENEYGSYYYYSYNVRVQKIKETEFYMGVTLAYNILLQQNDNLFIHYRQLNNNNSILYAEAPVHLLSKHFNCSESKVYKKYIDLFMGTNYIKKHNLVYSDNKYVNKEHQKEYIDNPEHFLNNNYKSFYLNKYYKMNDVYGNSFEETHPRVTPCSVIIFMDKFKETKLGKKVLNKIEFYKDIVFYTIQNNLNDPDLYRKNVYLTQEEDIQNNVIFSKTQLQQGVSCVSLNTLKKQHNSDGQKYSKRLKLFGKVEERSVESLLKFYNIICNNLVNIRDKDFKYYINLLHNLLQIIIDKIYSFFGSYMTNTMDIKHRLKIVKTYDLLKYYDNTYSLQINYKIQQQVKEKILDSNWYYNLGHNKDELDSLMNIQNISEIITEDDLNNKDYNSILNKEIYDIKSNIDLNSVELL